jgi:hypothetical protein
MSEEKFEDGAVFVASEEESDEDFVQVKRRPETEPECQDDSSAGQIEKGAKESPMVGSVVVLTLVLGVLLLAWLSATLFFSKTKPGQKLFQVITTEAHDQTWNVSRDRIDESLISTNISNHGKSMLVCNRQNVSESLSHWAATETFQKRYSLASDSNICQEIALHSMLDWAREWQQGECAEEIAYDTFCDAHKQDSVLLHRPSQTHLTTSGGAPSKISMGWMQSTRQQLRSNNTRLMKTKQASQLKAPSGRDARMIQRNPNQLTSKVLSHQLLPKASIMPSGSFTQSREQMAGKPSSIGQVFHSRSRAPARRPSLLQKSMLHTPMISHTRSDMPMYDHMGQPHAKSTSNGSEKRRAQIPVNMGAFPRRNTDADGTSVGPEADRKDQSTRQLKHADNSILFLTRENFHSVINDNGYVFVNFFVSWCNSCSFHPLPTWKRLSERVREKGMPVVVAAVDCIHDMAFCLELGVSNFPSIRWFEDGNYMDYHSLNELRLERVYGYYSFVKTRLMMKRAEKNQFKMLVPSRAAVPY